MFTPQNETLNKFDEYIFGSSVLYALGEYVYAGTVAVDGSDHGAMYYRRYLADSKYEYVTTISKEWRKNDDEDVWIGMVIYSNYRTVKCLSFPSQKS